MSKYFTLAACCLIHLVIGSVYADSALYEVICQSTGWERSWLVGGFSITILALGCAAASYRKYLQGMSCSTILRETAVLYMFTMGVIWMSILNEHPLGVGGYWLLCIIRGGCIGVMYVMTVSCVTNLFPNRRGLCSGLVVMSFGLGSLVAVKAYAYFLQFPLMNMILLQVIYWGVLLVATALFRVKGNIAYTSVSSVVAEPIWQKLSVIFFLNICIGITLLSNLVAITTERGIDYKDAMWLVGIAGIANGLGRIIYSTLSDTFGRLEVLRTALLIQTFCLMILPWRWEVGVLGIISVYGGGFALMPSICAQYLSDGANGYSVLLVWWGIAGLVGPMVYLMAPYIGLLLIASIVAVIITSDLILSVSDT